MKKDLTVLSLILILILNLIIFPKSASAEEKGIGVYPPIIKINATAPANISVPITVKNLEDKPIEVQISVQPFEIGSNGMVSLILHKDYTKEIIALIKKVHVQEGDQNVSKLVFSPQETKTLSLKADIDTGQENRDFYLSVVFTVNNKDISENTRSLISIGTATNVLISTGALNQSFSQSFSSPLLISEGHLKFNSSLTNTGAHFATVKPRVRITNIFGKIVEEITLTEEVMLPGETRTISNQHSDSLISSHLKYLFGPYKATLSINSSPQEALQSKSVFIFVLPGGTIWLIIGIVGALILLTQRLRSRAKYKTQ